MTVQLYQDYTFSIEPADTRKRLIVFKNGAEYVCRKATVGLLTRFLQSGDSSAFKGRLQLHKEQTVIRVNAKGELAGIIPVSIFEQLLNQNAL